MTKKFLKVLAAATGKVQKHFFEFSYAPEPGKTMESKHRERPYCYELYHQLRLLLDADRETAESGYVLSGEINKSGLGQVYGNLIPDLVFHVPGKMKNLVVIEVKSISTKDGIDKDVETLGHFVSAGEYEKAVHLVYGRGAGDDIERFKREHQRSQCKDVALWWHQECGQPAREVQLVRDASAISADRERPREAPRRSREGDRESHKKFQ